ncbi:hypothetical protein BD324DRAFT_373826 [Kockovaella imperatae]|uniref:LsmAD domain-containing protein n=1 Tax=Kockovaella imperatae TaxID=4999 RepID=A0A1Y1UND8_9TREE|nr:hypothetical protein BD324DRAFT_373826 [Kockovaella imperatae]ORX38645.1 hypothetical protein BD324DRAFT_373826 [Kockovaella imperatae]
MSSMRGRGRSGGGAPGGPGVAGRGGGPVSGEAGNIRRGSWRGGPPGSGGSHASSRGASPALAGASPAPRQSINDHMNEMGKVGDKAKPQPKGFATDTDISGTSSPGAQRELKPWIGDEATSQATPNSNGKANGGPGRDAETFGSSGGSNIPWDQFETNARLFGTKTSYQEELYTTKLNRGGADYKKREKEADRLANEILGQTSANVHVAEERNHTGLEDDSKGEEEKYSGVQRNPNAYVPPAARKSGAPIPTRPSQPGTNTAKVNGSHAQTALSPSAQNAPLPMAKTPSSQGMTVPQPPVRGTSGDVPASEKAPTDARRAVSPQPKASEPVESQDNQSKPTVVDQFRQFVGTERERVEAKKQTMIKLDRERTLADFKKFQTNFKVPLPMPKDILPLLSKDEEKQKTIEANAASNLESVKARKTSTDATASIKSPPSGSGSRKISIQIAEIPPFKPKQPPPPPPQVTLPESARNDIPQSTSPTPSATSHASNTIQPKLNPKASAFVFKPNPSAAAFKPGQPSSSLSPASIPPQPAIAGPSAYKNPFFREPPQIPKSINPRDDFNPWKHDAPVAAASSIQPQWPYTGRKYGSGIMNHPLQPMHVGVFEEDPTSPQSGPPMPMPGMPPNFSPYGYRFGPGMPPQQIPGQMHSNPMFSPGPGFNHLQGGPIPHVHMAGGQPQPNVPMYFQNGMPQNPQHFIPPQHMPYNPNTPTRPGPGGPSPNGMNAPMYFSSNLPTPQQTPQMHHNILQPPPPHAQFSTSPIPHPQMPQ